MMMLRMSGTIFLTFLFQLIHAQTTKLWTGGASGTWSVFSNWSPSGTPAGNDTVIINTDATILLDINLNLGGLRILNNANVVLNAPASRDVLLYGTQENSPALLVESGAILTMLTSGASGAFHMAFASSAKAWINGTLICKGNSPSGDARLEGDVAGTNRIYINGIYLSDENSGNLTGDTRNLFFNAGSTYQLNDNGGLIPNAFFDSLSTIKITGTTNAQPTFLTSGFSDKYYGSIIYDGGKQTADINLSISSSVNYKSIVKGSFQVSGSNGRKLYMATNLRNFFVWNDFIIGNESKVILAGGSLFQMSVFGNFSIEKGSRLDLTEGANNTDTVNIGGNLSIAGQVNGGGYLHLNGNKGKQSIIETPDGVLQGTSLNLVINNVSGVRLLSDLFLPHSLILKEGIIETGPLYTISMTDGSAGIFDASGNSYINGNLSRATGLPVRYQFPVGDEFTYRPVDLQPCCSTLSTFTVSYVGENPYTTIGSTIAQPLTGISNTEYWHVTGDGRATLIIPLSGTVSASPRNPIESDTLMIATWSSSNEWQPVYNPAGILFPGTISSGELISGDLSTGGPFDAAYTIAYRADVLPIKLFSFDATRQADIISLQWVTDGLENNGWFEVMQSSDARHYESVSRIKSIVGQTQYNFLVRVADNATKYFKLKIIDGDGRITFSNVVVVQINSNPDIRLQPNPATSSTNLHIISTMSGTINARIYSQDGRLVLNKAFLIIGGFNQFPLQLGQLSKGMYEVQVWQDKRLLSAISLIKQ
jgi:hypothetical protein